MSDSSETSGSSAFTVSPTLTKISITGTSLKSPMSGTRTSATPAGALTGDGGALTLGLAASAGAGAAAAPPSPSNSMITLPSLTLSPTFTAMDLTTAAARRRHVHRRLVGFERDQRVLGLHRVADLHEDLDHRHVA